MLTVINKNFHTHRHPVFRTASLLCVALLAATLGCGTTTRRVATEQLLISDAVDQVVAELNFETLRGQKVYLDTRYLRPANQVGFVNSDYIISSLRQRLTAAHCQLEDAKEKADVIVEARVGALGTDAHEVVYGIPQSGSVSSAASIISKTPLPPLPELSLGKSHSKQGIAKITVFAYDRKTRDPIWQSGITRAEATSRDIWVLGIGPFQRGTIYDGVRFAGKDLPSGYRKTAKSDSSHDEYSPDTFFEEVVFPDNQVAPASYETPIPLKPSEAPSDSP